MLSSKPQSVPYRFIQGLVKRSLSSSSSNLSYKTIQEGDRVVLRLKNNPENTPFFTKPLTKDGFTTNCWGKFQHSSLIGKESREDLVTSSGHRLRVYQPTLEEYVTLSPRLVTPVYPADANLIVSLLDLHPSPPSTRNNDGVEAPLEILEGGTGHGSLTLHLARAIHAANPPLPKQHWVPDQCTNQEPASANKESPPLTERKPMRQAILHTVDVVENNTNHAKKVVRGFRRGMYVGDVDFYTDDVSAWINSESNKRLGVQDENGEFRPRQPFLDHIILDMPGADDHVVTAAAALKPAGLLITFSPSINQIQAIVNLVREKNLPLFSEKYLELATGWSGGRPWDIRAVKPRKVLKQELAAKVQAQLDLILGKADQEDKGSKAAEGTAIDENALDDSTGWEMVSRPKVGIRVVGGGFVGVWRKKRPLTNLSSSVGEEEQLEHSQ